MYGVSGMGMETETERGPWGQAPFGIKVAKNSRTSPMRPCNCSTFKCTDYIPYATGLYSTQKKRTARCRIIQVTVREKSPHTKLNNRDLEVAPPKPSLCSLEATLHVTCYVARWTGCRTGQLQCTSWRTRVSFRCYPSGLREQQQMRLVSTSSKYSIHSHSRCTPHIWYLPGGPVINLRTLDDNHHIRANN